MFAHTQREFDILFFCRNLGYLWRSGLRWGKRQQIPFTFTNYSISLWNEWTPCSLGWQFCCALIAQYVLSFLYVGRSAFQLLLHSTLYSAALSSLCVTENRESLITVWQQLPSQPPWHCQSSSLHHPRYHTPATLMFNMVFLWFRWI